MSVEKNIGVAALVIGGIAILGKIFGSNDEEKEVGLSGFNNQKSRLKVTPNYRDRTFTIRKYIDGKIFAKYRTIELSQKEFDSEERNTENDWKQFLKSDDYYKV